MTAPALPPPPEPPAPAGSAASPPPVPAAASAVVPATADPWLRVKALKGWQAALVLLALAVGPLVVGEGAASASIDEPGAPVEVGGVVRVPTFFGWELVVSGESFARWQRGSHVIYVRAAPYEGTSTDLLEVLQRDIGAAMISFGVGEPGTAAAVQLGSVAVVRPFVGTFRSSADGTGPGGPAPPVEGILAAAAGGGVGVVYVAYSPEGRFRLAAPQAIATLQSIERVGR